MHEAEELPFLKGCTRLLTVFLMFCLLALPLSGISTYIHYKFCPRYYWQLHIMSKGKVTILEMRTEKFTRVYLFPQQRV